MRLAALVALEGFEPSQAEPESEVLPLHHRAIFPTAKVQIYFHLFMLSRRFLLRINIFFEYRAFVVYRNPDMMTSRLLSMSVSMSCLPSFSGYMGACMVRVILPGRISLLSFGSTR